MCMLELKNLVFTVEDDNGEKRNIIDGINLVIGEDKFVVVTGPNGSGKSTLARLIMGIEKPTGGNIIFNGEDITGLPVSERAKKGI